jgi:hypothetical protein
MAAGYAAAMILAAMMASGKWSPRLWWYRWRHRRVRRHLEVIEGGRDKLTPGPGRRRPKTDEKYIN